MDKITEDSIALIAELKKFSPDLLDLRSSVADDRFEKFEKEIGLELPLDFKIMMKKHNGISLDGTEVYPLDPGLKSKSLDSVYYYEHYSVGNPMPKHFVPFSPDGAGNHYCLNLSKINNRFSPVVFWQHDFNYENEEDIEVCNDSFFEWIREVLIDWTLEDYNYDGTGKQ